MKDLVSIIMDQVESEGLSLQGLIDSLRTEKDRRLGIPTFNPNRNELFQFKEIYPHLFIPLTPYRLEHKHLPEELKRRYEIQGLNVIYEIRNFFYKRFILCSIYNENNFPYYGSALLEFDYISEKFILIKFTENVLIDSEIKTILKDKGLI